MDEYRSTGKRPPTPPPLPPAKPEIKLSSIAYKVRSAPPGWMFQSYAEGPELDPFLPPAGPYFLYGTLRDPRMLAEILDLREPPSLRPAYVEGYKAKLWGHYPALVDGETGAKVEGSVFNVATIEDAQKLAYYETVSYKPVICRISFTDREEPATVDGHTFMFVGNPRDLSDGVFNLDDWLRLMGRRSVTSSN